MKLLYVLLVSFTTVPLAAQVGFNAIGYTITPTPLISIYFATAVDSKNRVIAVGAALNGYAAIVRYLPTGQLDTTFNGIGSITNDNFNSEAYQAIVVDSLDRIIVAGYTSGNDPQGLIVCYKSDGTLDVTFNGQGYVLINSAGTDYCYGLAIDSVGRVIVGGQSSVGNTAFVKRYSSTGGLETTFNFGNSQAVYCYDLTIDLQGRIIVVGGTGATGIVVCFTSNGVLDTTFDSRGYVATTANLGTFLFSVVADSRNRIITVGVNNAGDGVILCYNQLGVLDSSFNQTGYINTENGTNANSYYDVVIDRNNKILIAGITDATPEEGLIIRYTQDGHLDTTFNRTGFVKSNQSYDGMALTAENKIVAVGNIGANGAVAARYCSSGDLDSQSNWNLKNYQLLCHTNNTLMGLLSGSIE